MKNKPRFQLVFPFTPNLIDIQEEEIPKIHNRPLSTVLKKINFKTRWNCEAVYFSERNKPYLIEHEILYRFFPLSFRNSNSSKLNGTQVSMHELLSFFIDPPQMVAIFFAYGKFSKILALLAWSRRVPYVIIVGGWYNQINQTQKWYYDHAFRVLVHTEMQKNALINIGYLETNIEIFPVGVDIELFKAKKEIDYELRKDWPKLLYVGRLQASKGVREAVIAFSAVKNQYPSASLKIVGPCNTPDFLVELNQLISDWKLNDSVEITGPIQYEDLPTIYNNADLFLFPSPYEGLPYVVLEAMACGTPPVVMRGSGGTEEAVIHDDVGWVVDMPRLAYELLRILSNPKKIRSMGINAAQRIKDQYSSERTYNILLNLLQTIQS